MPKAGFAGTMPTSPGFIGRTTAAGRAGDSSQNASRRVISDLRLRRPTLLTGNVLPEDLSALFDDRVASRLTAGHMLEVAGVDRRSISFKQRMTVVEG